MWRNRVYFSVCLYKHVSMCYLGDSRRGICDCDTQEFDRSSGHKVGSYQDNTGTQGIMGNRV